jgi:hypothetical protein
MDPNVRYAIMVAGLLFVILFGGMTVVVAAQDGLTVLVVFAILIVVLLGVAIWGAINNPPDDRR